MRESCSFYFILNMSKKNFCIHLGERKLLVMGQNHFAKWQIGHNIHKDFLSFLYFKFLHVRTVCHIWMQYTSMFKHSNLQCYTYSMIIDIKRYLCMAFNTKENGNRGLHERLHGNTSTVQCTSFKYLESFSVGYGTGTM